MNQPFISQGLTSIVGATLAVALEKLNLAVALIKQASSAKKFLFQNETYLKQISLTEPLERDYYQALKISVSK